MLHRTINAHPDFRFPHLAWIFSLTRLRFDTPEASIYIFHAWRIMEISIIEIIALDYDNQEIQQT